MKTPDDLLKQAIDDLNSELNQVNTPDLTNRIISRARNQSNSNQSIITLKRFAIAAAILLSVLNGTVVWSTMSETNDQNQTSELETVYQNSSDWSTLLTLNEN